MVVLARFYFGSCLLRAAAAAYNFPSAAYFPVQRAFPAWKEWDNPGLVSQPGHAMLD